jgi:glycine oxidase
VSVVGGGIIGLSIAWECARRGHRVTVHDPDPGGGASHVAAGMLAPVGESYFGERELTELLLECARRWPGYAAELAAATGHELGHRTEGTLQVGLTADDLAQLRRLWAYQRELGAEVVALDGDALREREPLLHPRARGVLVASDHQVDPRRVVAALRELVPVRQGGGAGAVRPGRRRGGAGRGLRQRHAGRAAGAPGAGGGAAAARPGRAETRHPGVRRRPPRIPGAPPRR